jgi:hypothetical protein
MFTTAGVDADPLIPTKVPPELLVFVLVYDIEPADADAPIVFPDTVPILTLPAVTLIPHMPPPDVDEVFPVLKFIFLIVFPCTDEATEVDTESAMA